ncbi:MAG: 2-oxoglutarate and iron-dependent oxygenase domain-containing protein, partial [Bryobacteraceae bacterium]
MRAIGLWNISEIDNGCFTLRHPLFPAERCAEALADSRAFFELPVEAKQALAIEGSPHFRGYSEMRNERDWREQIHLGREEPAQGGGPAYMQLCGPNRWPEDSRWRARVQRLMADLESAGREILAELGARLGLPEAQFLGVTE